MAKLSDQEKKDRANSALLAQAMGWKVENVPVKPLDPDTWFHRLIVDAAGNDVGLDPLGTGNVKRDVPLRLNLYAPANMALAWRVLNWAWKHADDDMELKPALSWLSEIDQVICYDDDPAPAQRLWLDKILELAIAAEIILHPSSDVRTRTYTL